MSDKDEFSVSIQTEAVNIFGNVRGSHSGLHFRIGDKVIELDGAAYDSASGHNVMDGMDPAAIIMANTRVKAISTIRGVDKKDLAGDPGPSSGSKGNGEDPGSEVIFRGDKAAVYEMLAKALEAANYINQRDMSYHSIGFIVQAQNCNSVTNTLVGAIGLQHHLPETSIAAFAFNSVGGQQNPRGNVGDGKNRNLLPRDWQSRFEGLADRIRANGGELLPADLAAMDHLMAVTNPRVITQQMQTYNAACADEKKRNELLGPDLSVIEIPALCLRDNDFVNDTDHAPRPADRLNEAAQVAALAALKARQQNNSTN